MSAPSDNNGRLGEYEPCRVYQQDTNKGTAAWSNQDSVRLSSKLVRHLSPLCSSFLFLSASCLPGDWWGGLWWSTMSMFLLSGLPVQARLSPPANRGRARPENATLIEGWAAEPFYSVVSKHAEMAERWDDAAAWHNFQMPLHSNAVWWDVSIL